MWCLSFFDYTLLLLLWKKPKVSTNFQWLNLCLKYWQPNNLSFQKLERQGTSGKYEFSIEIVSLNFALSTIRQLRGVVR